MIETLVKSKPLNYLEIGVYFHLNLLSEEKKVSSIPCFLNKYQC